jgi:exonuclease III
MPVKLRIATFNLENLDDIEGQKPSLDDRIAVMQPQLARLRADILCLQEIHGQESQGQPRSLLALDRLLAGTQYANYNRVSTKTQNNEVFNERNLVILTHFEILEHGQFKHDFARAPRYQKVTAKPAETEAKDITWERPILHAKIKLDAARSINVINLHLKSKLPTTISGQVDRDVWNTSSAWAEGFFISSMKRVGQAVETIRGDIENTNNPLLARRVMVPCEMTIPESSRFSLKHLGRGNMLDHLLVSRNLLAFYRGAEIHNELLHDESIAFATDQKFPESDHAPVIAEFELPD